MLGSYGCSEQNANKIMVWAAGMVSSDMGDEPGQLPYGFFTRDSRPLERSRTITGITPTTAAGTADFGKGVSSYHGWPLIWCRSAADPAAATAGAPGRSTHGPDADGSAGPGDMSTTTSPVPDGGVRRARVQGHGFHLDRVGEVLPYHTAEIMTLPNQIWHADTPHRFRTSTAGVRARPDGLLPGAAGLGEATRVVPQDVARGDWTASLQRLGPPPRR
jgi:hypothetical protein